ncbi:MAG: DEAD/DEAH box helicase [Bacteroidaceae bacterium]|nr:DEAD/DEAH box helicase [Bacteroidaceae bacterium]
MQFTDLELSDDVLDALYDMRFEECTPVQEKCIPPILDNKDVIGIAQTGTGKTAAYLLPMLTLLYRDPHPTDAVNCLIMAPTRELAKQIDQALQGFGYYVDVNGVAVYGGNDGIRYEQEKKSLSKGADIVIATPGRLITHLNLGTLDLSRTTHLILDEADRMLDMGFCEDILKIVEQLPKKRQTILFSATMPDKIVSLAHQIMNDPLKVSIAVSKPVERISQEVFICKEQDKENIVCNIFKENPPKRVIIFASSKQKVKALHLSLLKKGYNVAAMHSDLEQKQRDEVMMAFKAQRVDVLVATDIVARGIDIDDITLVINFDAPREAEDYVHRIGRTARAGRDGRAVTLVGEKDRGALASIESFLGKDITRMPLPEGLTAPKENEIETKKKPNRYKKNRKTSFKGKKTTSKRKEESQVSQGSKTNPVAKKTRTPRNRRADKTEA